MTYIYDGTEYEDLDKALQDAFDDLDSSEKVDLWNEFCNFNSYQDDYIYDMADLDDLLQDKSPSEILEMAYGYDFNPRNDYFRFTLYGIESSDYPIDWIEYSDMENWLLNHYEKYSAYLDIEEKDESEETEE